MSTMKITETETSVDIEGEGVDIVLEGKEWCIDTHASRIYFDQLLSPYDGETVNIKLSISLPESE